MNLDAIPEHRIPQWIAQHNIIGLALDRHPSGRIIAAEVRKDEKGEHRVTLGEMTVDDFQRLAAQMGLPILESSIASRQLMESWRLQQRKALDDDLDRDSTDEEQEPQTRVRHP